MRARTAVALAAVAAVCSGCGPAGTRGAADQPAAHPPRLLAVDGGTATVAVDAVPTTLNDHTVAGDTAAARAVASLVWAQVFKVGPHVTPVLDTDVVRSAEVVDLSPQTVVYQIAPRAVWSDGTPVSAQDFVYDWLSQTGSGQDVGGAPDSVAYSAGYRDIASVVGSNGGKTVTVVFTTPFADWESLFDDLLPAHVAERVGWNHGFDSFDPTALVSAGPFVVQAWTPGQRIVLARNPRWWETPAHLDQLVLQVMPGAPSMAEALRAGGADVAAPGAFDQSFLAAVSSSSTLHSQSGLGTTSVQVVFNTRRAPYDLTTVRQAISHFLDRASILSDLIQPIAPLAWEDNDHLFANAQPWYADDGATYVQSDPLAAAKLLEQAGLVADADGTWTLHGAPVTLQLAWAEDDPWSALVGPALVGQLVDAGFDVSASPVSSDALYGSVLPSHAFDLALVPLQLGPYPSSLSGVFGVPAGGGGGATSAAANWSGFDDPHVDALFTQAAGQLAADQARSLYQQIDNALWTAMPTLPLFAEPTAAAWSASLSGVVDDPGALGPLWSATQWQRLVAADRVPAPTTSTTAGG